MSVTLDHYLILSAVLFGLGLWIALAKRNAIMILMGVELMLNAVNLSFIAFSRSLGTLDAQVLVFFVLTVAAAEAAVGLAIVISMQRHRSTLDVDTFSLLKW